MSFITRIFSSKVDTITDTVKEAAGVAKAFSSKDNATERHTSDMLSDSWLSKSIRPLILIWLMLLFTGMVIASFYDLPIDQKYKDLIFYALLLAIGFYFPGRSAEKYIRQKSKNTKT